MDKHEQGRTRKKQMKFRVTDEEYRIIRGKMAEAGMINQEQFLRKQVMEGIIIHLELPELRELLRLLRSASNNLNQIAKHLHETGRIYPVDLEGVEEKQDELWEMMNRLLESLGRLV